MAMTVEQQRAVAIASARLRVQKEEEERGVMPAERLAANPLMRFALGAASPVLGAVQLGAEAMGVKGVSEHLKRVEEIKRAGMEEGAYDIAGILGTVASPAALAVMRIPAAGSVLGRAGQGAAIGAGFGATAPVTSGDEFAAQKAAQVGGGALIGGAIPPAMEATRKGYQIARNLVDPLFPGGPQRGAARLMSEAAGAKRPEIERLLAEDRMFVRGSQPTAAEAAAPAGSAEFSAMQRLAAERRPSEYAGIAKAQEQARLGAVQEVGKTKEVLGAAEASRAAMSGKMYKNAFEKSIRGDPELLAMSENPYFKDALPHAIKLAQAKGLNPKQNLTEFLHYVKLGLDKQLTKTGDTALSGTEKAATQDVKKALVEWIGRKNPAYNEARVAFAQASKPINRMEVGQELEKALTKPVGEGERVGVFGGAMREAPRTIKKATGQSVAKELGDILTGEELQAMRGVLSDLSRKAEYAKLSPQGLARAHEIEQAFGLPATGPLHQGYMIFKTVLGRLSRGINEKTLDTLATEMQLPKNALKLLQSAPTQQKQALIDSILAQKFGRGAIIGLTASGGRIAQD